MDSRSLIAEAGQLVNSPACSKEATSAHSQNKDTRLVFFLRHGESEWNRGSRTWEMDAICRMATLHDHALSEEGVRQARRLEGDILRAKVLSSDEQGFETRFISARTILCSPLTRAVQTAVVALRPLLQASDAVTPLRVRLMKEIRERRTYGGRDTTGSRVGMSVNVGVRQWLASVMGEEFACEYDDALNHVDYSNVQEQWWDNRAESLNAVEARISEFMEELRGTTAEQSPIIVVGHSIFFREVFRRYGGTDAKAFCDKVLCNCGVVAVTFEFADGSDIRITSQDLIFTSSLIERPGCAASLCMAASGPKAAVSASLLVLIAAAFREANFQMTAKIAGAVSLGLLLAQALQRFTFPTKSWMAMPLWLFSVAAVWILELGNNKKCSRQAA